MNPFYNILAALLLGCLLFPFSISAAPAEDPAEAAEEPARVVYHPYPGQEKAAAPDGSIALCLVGKKQFYDDYGEFLDTSVNSPKSVSVHPDGSKYYVNALEAGLTIVYDAKTNRKLAEISHELDETTDHLWGEPSGFYEFTHYPRSNHFMGKPVEAAFSHGGRYLWVTYYRRLYDINAQDPSALAVIDTATNKIIRLMETGTLPKMIAASPDGKKIAVSCWGDNTIGLIDCSSVNPMDWHYTDKFIVDYELPLNYSLTEPVDRDHDSGYALRGTAFTPDGKYLLAGCMGGDGGIAVIDLTSRQYLGRVMGMMPNVRHLVIKDGWLYLSINAAGYVQRTRLEDFMAAAIDPEDMYLDSWEDCAVGSGARTIVLSPDGRYVFAACYGESEIYVVDARTMEVVTSIGADSFPVGLAISPDGCRLYSTSQGTVSGEGDAVDIYEIIRPEREAVPPSVTKKAPDLSTNPRKPEQKNFPRGQRRSKTVTSPAKISEQFLPVGRQR